MAPEERKVFLFNLKSFLSLCFYILSHLEQNEQQNVFFFSGRLLFFGPKLLDVGRIDLAHVLTTPIILKALANKDTLLPTQMFARTRARSRAQETS